MKLPMKIVLGIVALCVIVAFTQMDFAEQQNKKEKAPQEEPKTLMHVASHTNQLSNFTAAVKTAAIVDTLEKKGPFTIFAPGNEAFARLPEGAYGDMMDVENNRKLRQIMNYHIVRGLHEADELENGQKLTTILGKKLTITAGNDTTSVGGATIIQSDITAANGIIHIVDRVIMPMDN